MDAVIEGQPLKQVMETVIKETGINVFIDQSLLDTRLSVSFKGLSVEEGLKKIVGPQSYIMVFSPGKDTAGNCPVKAIRIYPKGEPDKARYVSLNANGLAGFTSVGATVLTPQEVDDILERDEQVNLSHVSQENSKRKNGKDMGNTPGNRSLVDEAVRRAKELQKYRELKAKTLNQKTNYETRTALQIQKEKAAMDKIAFEHKRQEDVRKSLVRE